MKTYGVFDIIGPRMIGPSSSHTAGAAKIGRIGNRIVGGDVRKATVTLYESFATTGRGHGTDKAIAGGLLGFAPDDARLKNSFELAKEQGVEIEFVFSDKAAQHPNTARINVTDSRGESMEIVGASVGGGNIEILEVNGMEARFSCDLPTILVFHTDLPGVIARATSVFSEENINIATMRVYRTSKSQDAGMIIETDTAVEQETIDRIKEKTPEIKRIYAI